MKVQSEMTTIPWEEFQTTLKEICVSSNECVFEYIQSNTIKKKAVQATYTDAFHTNVSCVYVVLKTLDFF